MRPTVIAALAGASLALAPGAAAAQELMDLLAKGPVVLVENDAHGRFDRATAVVLVHAPAAKVWDVVSNFSNYRYFMPKVVKSEQRLSGPTFPNQLDVAYEIDVPISNAKYTFHYQLDPAQLAIHGKWLKGDLEGSFCDWKLVPHGDATLAYFTTASRNFSSLAQKLEDSQQTITIGVNVSAALATVKAIKKRVEGLSAVSTAKP
ncbi:MAG: SRPBCC family protein [Myxococcales bacterium]